MILWPGKDTGFCPFSQEQWIVVSGPGKTWSSWPVLQARPNWVRGTFPSNSITPHLAPDSRVPRQLFSPLHSLQSWKERSGSDGSTSVPFLLCFLMSWLFKAEDRQKFSILKEVWIVGELYLLRDIFYHIPLLLRGHPRSFKKYLFTHFWLCWVFVAVHAFLWLRQAGTAL